MRPVSPHNEAVIRKLLDSLTSRRVSLALMAFIVAAALAGLAIPQRSLTSIDAYDQWEAANPSLAPVINALSLDHVFSSWWFLGVMTLFALSLALATTTMLRTAWRRSTHVVPPRTMVTGVTIAEVTSRARVHGYHEVRSSGDHTRLVRHRIGWWGPAILHVGMILTLVAATISLAFTSRGIADLSIGESLESAGFFVVEPNAFGGVPHLDAPLRFDGFVAEYWPTGELKSWVLTLSLGDGAGGWRTYESTPNDPLDILGHTVYLSIGEFGNAAFVTFSGPSGADESVRLSFPQSSSGEPSYTEFELQDGTTIEARWDPQGVRGEELLTIRTPGDSDEPRVSLNEGDVGVFGDSSVVFEFAGQWARLIVVRPVAVLPLFVGFAIIGLGSLMIYLWVPREIILAKEPGGVRYTWRAARMPHLYLSERDELVGTTSEERM